MGWNTTDCDEVFTEPSGMMDTYTTAEMQFATSWDWLMPVVQKCYKIDNEEGFDMLVEDKLSSTHKAVVEFIKEYNNER